MKTVLILVATASLTGGGLVQADGLVRPPIVYKGSLQERSQEAILVFREGGKGKSAKNDLWFFPYYTDTRFVPLDKRDGGPALD